MSKDFGIAHHFGKYETPFSTLPSSPSAEDDMTDEPVEYLGLSCGWCGHWEKDWFTKEQVADWLRVHRNASIRFGLDPAVGPLASTCPHPCGTPIVREPVS